ncbi:MAG: hypothetical protein CMF12_08360 [Idiomarina sp.]|uniref:hypothetical protein n=1 Tax=Idiomarina sp. TaxID=1874361 RepID=UPI000C5AC6D3|nr:hypothetical protein [Idiomarina sp.]MBT42521.1 hypothetical protein [Idiomarina sp.]|tara:strand:+ start:1196 stop:1570 length:375 start_codon:yes stop_codon:yes gene_type:complete
MQQLLHECFRLRGKSYSDVDNAIAGTMYAVATINYSGKIILESESIPDGKKIPMLYLSRKEAFRQERKLSLRHFEWYGDFSSDYKAVAVRWDKNKNCLMLFEVEQENGEVGPHIDCLDATSLIL